MKSTKILYWVCTVFVFLFEGLMPALTGQTEFAKAGIRHLGYPDYFGLMLVVWKVVGALVLIVPQVPPRFKEWAYVGFGITMISAFISHFTIDGMSGMTLFPASVFAILVTSYVCYHRMQRSAGVPANA